MVEPMVKPLEWEAVLDPNDEEQIGAQAKTSIGLYSIETDPFSYSPTTAYYVDGPGGFRAQTANVAAAKAAAQADYEQRIRSVLSPLSPRSA